MATLSELQARLETLDRMIQNGVLSWQIGDKRTTYRSMNDLLTARDTLQNQIAALDTTAAKPVRQIHTYSRKGV